MKKGFTIVELLITISILAILTSIGFAVFSGVIVKARDTQRLKDLQAIKQALELYRGDVHSYPPTDMFTLNSPGITLTNGVNTYMNPVPVDRDPNRSYYYQASSNLSSFILCASREGTDTSFDIQACLDLPAADCGVGCNIGLSSQ